MVELRPTRRLDLDGSYNLRELGGYSTRDGQETRWKTFLRADSLHRLTKASQTALLDYGIKTVIDLRESVELREQPNVFHRSSEISYFHRPLRGDNPYKKVIAQQVRGVYPQAVSLTTEVVPDIYAIANIDNGYISLETDLQKGDKVRLIFEDKTALFDVLRIDKSGFKVSTDKTGKVFVYGREVDDFHSVDYESISMLNVSATQELYKLISKQQTIIDNQKNEMAEMRTDFDGRLKELEAIINTTSSNK